MVKIGDRLKVQGSPFAAYVEQIEQDKTNNTIIIHLDWKQYGKSRVFLHDEGKVWSRYAETN